MSIPIHLWTDSHVTLAMEWNPFVHQKVNEIEQFSATSWSFTPSKDNPADLLTRGITTTWLKTCKFWTHGLD